MKRKMKNENWLAWNGEMALAIVEYFCQDKSQALFLARRWLEGKIISSF